MVIQKKPYIEVMLKYVNYQKYDKKSKTTEINIHEKNMDSVK